jgi:signal transduction histidine kinase
VVEELDKLAEITQRLVTLYRIDGEFDRRPTDLKATLARAVHGWTPAAQRRWNVHATPGHVAANQDRLEAALDCLLDKAVKFTYAGAEINVEGRIGPRPWSIEVSDSGVGRSGAPPPFQPRVAEYRAGARNGSHGDRSLGRNGRAQASTRWWNGGHAHHPAHG